MTSSGSPDRKTRVSTFLLQQKRHSLFCASSVDQQIAQPALNKGKARAYGSDRF